jgi:ATP-dependent DNA helicase RecQ
VDRVRGRVVGAWDGRSRAAARTSAAEGNRGRWRQYRAVWAFVEGGACRRETLLRHFGDASRPEPEVPCCDVCAPDLVSAARASGAGGGAGGGGAAADLETAIAEVVARARPSVGRTRAVEILRGGRSRALRRNAHDGLPQYGAFAHLSGDEVLERVDAMLADGRLRSTGGADPTLGVAAEQPAA